MNAFPQFVIVSRKFVQRIVAKPLMSNSFWAVRPMLWDRCPVCLSVCLLVYCGQTVGWIKMSLDTEVGLGPGDVVLDGDPAPHFAIDRPSQLLLSMCFIITLIRMFIDMKAQSA